MLYSYKRSNKKFFIGSGFVLMLSLFYFFDDDSLLPAMLSASLVHELGHFLAIKFYGLNITCFRLELTGAVISYDNSKIPYSAEAFVAAMGPIFGIVFAVIAASLSRFNDLFLSFSGVSFCLSLFNLIPSRNLDGGRILRACIANSFNIYTAEFILFFSSSISALSLIAFGCFTFFSNFHNFSFLLTGLWLLFDFIRVSKRPPS